MGTAGPQPRAPDQWALPDLNRERQISVGTAGPQPRAPDQWALPDLNRERQISVGSAHVRETVRIDFR